MTADLICLAATHRTAPLGLREHLRPGAEKQLAMLARSEPMARGRFLLSTCERFEVYASGTLVPTGTWVRALADWFQLPARVLRRGLERCAGDDAARRLMRVASGLDSRVLGEPQILGQVRDAMGLARRAGSMDMTLHALGRSALRCGRRVRAETPLNRRRRSIATLAAERIAPSGTAGRVRVVLVGSGGMAEDVAVELGSQRGMDVVIAARNEERGMELAGRYRFRVARWSALAAELMNADAAVVCTSSPTHVITGSMVLGRVGKALTLVDLSVPRNVDPDARLAPGVRLVHLEDLLADAPRGVGAASALAIVDEEMSGFVRWRAERRAVPAIRALVDRLRRDGRLETLEDRRRLHHEIQFVKRLAVEGARAEFAA